MWSGVIVGSGLASLGFGVVHEAADPHLTFAGDACLLLGAALIALSVRLLWVRRRRF
jgi:hypothetical protein